MARWGSPSITPHAALAELIEIAGKGGAAAIVVDIDLASENPAATPNPALVEAISNHQENVLPVMFVRSFRVGAVSDNEIGGAALVNTTPYDGLIAATAKAMWVSVLTPLSDDRIVRRLRLWQTVCAGAEGVSYPSPALVVAAKFAAEADRSDALKTFLSGQVYCRCKRLEASPAGWPHRATPDVAIQYMFNADAEGGDGQEHSARRCSRRAVQADTGLDIGKFRCRWSRTCGRDSSGTLSTTASSSSASLTPIHVTSMRRRSVRSREL